MNKIKGIIRVEVPEWQIGEPVTVYFKDTMMTKGICVEEDDEMHRLSLLVEEYENKKKRNPVIVCPHCGKRVK